MKDFFIGACAGLLFLLVVIGTATVFDFFITTMKPLICALPN